ncbi:hypothetical protein [Streptomyces sp. NPDC002057]|uniref:hypothetical protein n=1 Tax=Streptomyces sp. NPDC002057 TaxID=3154664 RepID=UPI003326E294
MLSYEGEFMRRVVREWWRETPKAIRWVAYISVPLGVAATVLGVYGDGHGWWDDRGFLTNLVSSFTSLLFGVPTALVVLSHLNGQQAQAMERRIARNRAEAAKAAYLELALRHVRSDAHSTYELAAAELVTTGRELVSALTQHPPHPQAGALLEKRRTDFQRTFTGGGAEQAEWITSMLLVWEQFDGEIRPLVEGAGLSWLPLNRYGDLRAKHKALAAIDTKALFHDFDAVEQVARTLWSRASSRHQAARQKLLADAQAFNAWASFVADLETILRDIARVGR